MPVIVVFGDSNTWGYDPATGGRFPRAQRWPSVLQRELGPDFEVIAEGLNGRTTVHDDPIEPYRCGADALPSCLMSHAPLDFVILALGCNDLKKRFSVSAFDIAEGAARLIALARVHGQRSDARPPKILLIAPPPIAKAPARGPLPASPPPKILLIAPPPIAKLTAYAEMFEGGQEKSVLLGQRYRDVAEREGVAFLDAGHVIRCSDLDGIHYEVDQHELLGRAVAETVREALAPPVVSIE